MCLLNLIVNMSHLKFEEITKRIIGCAFTIHKTLGNGFQEVIYQRCMQIEMDRQ